MFLNCGAAEGSYESLGLQGDQTVDPEGNQPWLFIGRTHADAPILWPDAKSQLIRKDPDAGGEGHNSGLGGWMASPTQWTWIWANSGK